VHSTCYKYRQGQTLPHISTVSLLRHIHPVCNRAVVAGIPNCPQQEPQTMGADFLELFSDNKRKY